jgi:hypothetical protein
MCAAAKNETEINVTWLKAVGNSSLQIIDRLVSVQFGKISTLRLLSISAEAHKLHLGSGQNRAYKLTVQVTSKTRLRNQLLCVGAEFGINPVHAWVFGITPNDRIERRSRRIHAHCRMYSQTRQRLTGFWCSSVSVINDTLTRTTSLRVCSRRVVA